MPATVASYSASSRPWAAAAWPASVAKVATAAMAVMTQTAAAGAAALALLENQRGGANTSATLSLIPIIPADIRDTILSLLFPAGRHGGLIHQGAYRPVTCGP